MIHCLIASTYLRYHSFDNGQCSLKGLEEVKAISDGCSKRLQIYIVLNVHTYVQPKLLCPDTMGNVYCVKSTIVTRHFLFRCSEESLWRLSIDRWGKKGGAGEADTNVMGSLWVNENSIPKIGTFVLRHIGYW